MVTLEEAWDNIKIPDTVEDNTDPKIYEGMSDDDYFNACRLLFNRADDNNDRRIDYKEFKKLYMKVHPDSSMINGSDK